MDARLEQLRGYRQTRFAVWKDGGGTLITDGRKTEVSPCFKGSGVSMFAG